MYKVDVFFCRPLFAKYFSGDHNEKEIDGRSMWHLWGIREEYIGFW